MESGTGLEPKRGTGTGNKPGVVSGTRPETESGAMRAIGKGTGCRLYLIGFMASGKSQLGRRLSSLLGCKLYDTDTCIEQRTGMSVSEIFAKKGEHWFREEESRLIRNLPDEDCVVVTGGGLPCQHGNMEYIRLHGAAVYVEVSERTLVQRLQKPENQAGRPLLKDMPSEEISFFVKNKLKEREYFYKQAGHCFRPEEEDFNSLLQWARKLFLAGSPEKSKMRMLEKPGQPCKK